MNMKPLTAPRRAGGMCGKTVGAASTISAPPPMPETKRQVKNHAKSTGQAQAKSATVVIVIMARRTARADDRATSGPASKAPAR